MNIFPMEEVDCYETGWVVDLSPDDVTNRDYWWFFNTRREANRFMKSVNSGMRPDEAAYYVAETSHAAAALGRIRTEKKAASSRENGKKGGRPRKE